MFGKLMEKEGKKIIIRQDVWPVAMVYVRLVLASDFSVLLKQIPVRGRPGAGWGAAMLALVF